MKLPQRGAVRPAQGNALGKRASPMRHRPNGPTVFLRRTVGPLGRRRFHLSPFPRALPWAGRTTGPSARQPLRRARHSSRPTEHKQPQFIASLPYRSRLFCAAHIPCVGNPLPAHGACGLRKRSRTGGMVGRGRFSEKSLDLPQELLAKTSSVPFAMFR